MLDQVQQLALKQRLSARQIQQIQLLEVPAIELGERIRRELEENPALEEGTQSPLGAEYEGAPEQEAPGGEEVFNPGEEEYNLPPNDYAPDPQEYSAGEGDNARDPDGEEPLPGGFREDYARESRYEPANPEPTLAEALKEQAALLALTPQETLIARYIIGNIAPSGYLERPAQQISNDILFKESVDVSVPAVEEVLRKIQTLDPPGVAARTLQECLQLQLDRLPPSAAPMATARLLVGPYFGLYSARDFSGLQAAGIGSEAELRAADAFIRTLNPKPGNAYGADSASLARKIYPDFIVLEEEGELRLYLTDLREIPTLSINPLYLSLAARATGRGGEQRGKSAQEAGQFAARKVDRARWFIRSLQQRFQTLRATMSAIIRLQEDFFRSGQPADLKPMTLKDVAALTGQDPGTVSRVNNSKYVQCTHGIYPLKFFFTEGVRTASGQAVSKRRVLHMLQEMIEAEDKRQPLSDEALARKLTRAGFTLARRTVAKYRQRLGILPAKLRRAL